LSLTVSEILEDHLQVGGDPQIFPFNGQNLETGTDGSRHYKQMLVYRSSCSVRSASWRLWASMWRAKDAEILQGKRPAGRSIFGKSKNNAIFFAANFD